MRCFELTDAQCADGVVARWTSAGSQRCQARQADESGQQVTDLGHGQWQQVRGEVGHEAQRRKWWRKKVVTVVVVGLVFGLRVSAVFGVFYHSQVLDCRSSWTQSRREWRYRAFSGC